MEGVEETEAQSRLSPEHEVVSSQELGLLSLPPGPPPPSSHHAVPSLWTLCGLHPRTLCLQLLAGCDQRGSSGRLAGAPSAPPCLVALVDFLPDPGPFSTQLLPPSLVSLPPSTSCLRCRSRSGIILTALCPSFHIQPIIKACQMLPPK